MPDEKNRIPERLADGLTRFPRQQVLDLYAAVVDRLEARGLADDVARSRAYSGVMSMAAICHTVGHVCPTPELVLAAIDRGEDKIRAAQAGNN
jgi:hypothetical protein